MKLWDDMVGPQDMPLFENGVIIK